jgi:hypothetical protein
MSSLKMADERTRRRCKRALLRNTSCGFVGYDIQKQVASELIANKQLHFRLLHGIA